ncbi:MAG: Gfo/Idh/MocA family oxidoreductase [Bryobacteraceae bacterium]|nr:Gfo/Idh/MocA family oxidoreductase [Bryobacteraceae bacterium]
MSDSTTRRTFLKTATAATGILPATSSAHVLGANDRIRLGMIGVGGMGSEHLSLLMKQSEEKADIAVVAVSDIYQARKDRAQALAHLPASAVHHDYRDLLNRADVDAVFIEAPDHWHAQMALDALAAGKDVYLQKPMTLTLEEARAVTAAVKKHQRVLQVGSQHLSDERYHRARAIIQSGEIGDLLWAQTTYSGNVFTGYWNYRIEPEAAPSTLDWNRWLGPAPKRPFSAERYFRWRKYWDYSSGIASDLYYHRLAPLMFAMNVPAPTRVCGAGGIYVQKDREVPDTFACLIEFPACYIAVSGSTAAALSNTYMPPVIYGHKGAIVFEHSAVHVVHEPLFGQAAGNDVRIDTGDDHLHLAHIRNFLDCMRSRNEPRLGPELGERTMAAIRLGVDSYRQDRLLLNGRPPARSSYQGDGKNNPTATTIYG